MSDEQLIIEEDLEAKVAWTAQDAWWGVAALGVWLAVAIWVAVVANKFSWELNLPLFLAVGELSLLIPVWWIVFRKYQVSWEMLGFRPLKGRMVALGLRLLFLFYSVNICFNLILAYFEIRNKQELGPLLEQPSTFAMVAFSAVIIAPFVEEVFFRGFVFAGFREKYGWEKAAVISALFFSFVHLNLITAVPIFVLGYLFAYLYHKSNSLWLPIFLHFTVNGLAFLLLGLVSSL